MPSRRGRKHRNARSAKPPAPPQPDRSGSAPLPAAWQPAQVEVWRLDAKLVFGLVVTLLLTAVNIYRAATRSIAGDEALTYHWYLSGGWSLIFTSYSANNHVLYSLLAKASISLFPVSEFSLRLPALGAGILYLLAACRISAALCRSFPAYALCFLAISLNPLVLDFLSYARGYGLATAALLWAMYESIRDRSGAAPNPVRLGAWCAVAVCANLTLATAVAALFTALAARRLAMRKPLRPLLAAAALAALICAVILAPPLRHANRDNFYAGTNTVAEAFLSLTAQSIPEAGRPDRLWTAAALLLLASAMAAYRPGTAQALPAQVLLLCLAALYAAHRLIGLPLPLNRTGLYLIPLFILAVAGAIELLPRSLLARGLKAAAGGIAVIVLFYCARNFRLDRYAVWPESAATKQAVNTIRRRVAQQNLARPVRVAATNWVYPAREFYARTEPGWFVSRVVDRGCIPYDYYFSIPPSGEPDPPAAAGAGEPPPKYDFYLLLHYEWGHLARCGLTEIERYPEARTLLAVPANPKPAAR